MTRRLILLVGLLRSGKTTYARKLGVPIINPESIRQALHGRRSVGAGEGFVWATARLMAEALFLAGHEAVVVDTMNGLRRHRERWYSSEWDCEWHTLATEPRVCIDRAVRVGDVNLGPSIEQMMRSWEPVLEYEGKIIRVEPAAEVA